MKGSDELLYLTRRLHLAAGERVQPRRWRPAADIYRTPTGWLIKVELAGVRQEDIELLVSDRTLMVRGQRSDTELLANRQHHSLEITYHAFERCFELPAELEHAQLETEYHNGMFLIHIESEAARP